MFLANAEKGFPPAGTHDTPLPKPRTCGRLPIRGNWQVGAPSNRGPRATHLKPKTPLALLFRPGSPAAFWCSSRNNDRLICRASPCPWPLLLVRLLLRVHASRTHLARVFNSLGLSRLPFPISLPQSFPSLLLSLTLTLPCLPNLPSPAQAGSLTPPKISLYCLCSCRRPSIFHLLSITTSIDDHHPSSLSPSRI